MLVCRLIGQLVACSKKKIKMYQNVTFVGRHISHGLTIRSCKNGGLTIKIIKKDFINNDLDVSENSVHRCINPKTVFS